MTAMIVRHQMYAMQVTTTKQMCGRGSFNLFFFGLAVHANAEKIQSMI